MSNIEMSDIDLTRWRTSSDLVNAIWEVRRANRRDLKGEVAQLLEHDSPIVREEAISLLFVRWAERELRPQLVELIRSDPDPGVRSRAAGALAILSDEATRNEDGDVLRAIVLNRREESSVRQASYEALYRITFGTSTTLKDDVDLDNDVDLRWVRET